jgi:hypothetical protein
MSTVPSQTEPACNAAGADLKQFTLFPNLPAELRIKIWKFLLPNGPVNDGNRIFRLRIEVDESEHAKFGMGLQNPSMYTYTDDTPAQKSKEIQMEREYKEDMRNLALLGACQESRVLFFEKSKSWNTLPATHGGTIYFENLTTIYIEGLMEVLFPMHRTQAPTQLGTAFDILPSEFNSIQHLVVSFDRHMNATIMALLKRHKFRTFKYDMDGLWRSPLGVRRDYNRHE